MFYREKTNTNDSPVKEHLNYFHTFAITLIANTILP